MIPLPTRHWLARRRVSGACLSLAIIAAELGASASDAGVELVCPCGVLAVEQTALGAVFGVRSKNADGVSGPLRLSVSALNGEDVQLGRLGDEIAEFHLGPVGGRLEHPVDTRVAGLVVLGRESRAGVRMVLWEGDEIADSIRMVGMVDLGQEGGAAEDTPRFGTGGLHIRGSVTGEFEGPSISATIPHLVNTSPITASGLMVRIYATQEPTLYAPYRLVYQQALPDEIAPGSSIREITVSGVRLATSPPGFDYHHVAIVKAPAEGVDPTSWQTLYVWQTAQVDGVPSFARRGFSLTGIEVLSDSDGDGVSDFNEARFADANPHDATSKPPPSTIKLLILYARDAAREVGSDIFDIVDDEIAGAQRVFDDSGVAVNFELAGTEPVDAVGAIDAIARAAISRMPPFEDLDDRLSQSKADLAVVVRLGDRFETYCGAGETRGISHRGDFIGRDGVAVVNLLCRRRALAHELGHIMGLGHSRREAGRGTFPWSVGHGANDDFVTIMATRSAFPGATEVALFSNPSVLCGSGVPCGVDHTDPIHGADAVRTLETTRFQVAAFTGAEPPQIVLVGENPHYTAIGWPFVDPGFTVEDDGDSDLESQVTAMGKVNTQKLGSYDVTYRVVDTDGNVGETNRTVIVAIDTDGDGQADRVDQDDDGDGMPDQYEAARGFDPLAQDAHVDADGDGISNLSEYRSGTNPRDTADLPARSSLVPYFPGGHETARQGFVRLINHSNRAGDVRVQAWNDDGVRFEPLLLPIKALATLHFNSRDLELGNPSKGLLEGLGVGQRDWWLEVSSDLDLEVFSYLRTPDGFVSEMHEPITRVSASYHVPIFNPGWNLEAPSVLRLLNPSDEAVRVTIRGIDDSGGTPGGAVSVTVPAGAARMLSAPEMESGEGVEGALGFGEGKWRFVVESTAPIVAMNLLEDAAGKHTNLSSSVPKAEIHVVPFFASPDGQRQGFVRVINHADVLNEVRIEPIDDAGRRHPINTILIGARRVIGFDADALREGDVNGLIGIGRVDGDLRLEVKSELPIEVLSYARTEDGFLTAMHGQVRANANGHRTVMFNPARNPNQVSLLRMVNLGDIGAVVLIQGTDDAGLLRGEIAVELAALASRTLTSTQLERGAPGIHGALGPGTGKWRLMVTSSQPLIVMSLLSSRTGHLTNLSVDPCHPASPSGTDHRAGAGVHPWSCGGPR